MSVCLWHACDDARTEETFLICYVTSAIDFRVALIIEGGRTGLRGYPVVRFEDIIRWVGRPTHQISISHVLLLAVDRGMDVYVRNP